MKKSLLLTGEPIHIQAIQNLINELNDIGSGEDIGLIKALDLSPEMLKAFLSGLANSWQEERKRG